MIFFTKKVSTDASFLIKINNLLIYTKTKVKKWSYMHVPVYMRISYDLCNHLVQLSYGSGI